jgi:hypothetical protein
VGKKKGGPGGADKKKPKFRVMQDRFIDDPSLIPDVIEANQYNPNISDNSR